MSELRSPPKDNTESASDAKKLADLPPSYTNLGYDGEPVAGPSAPRFQDHEDDGEPVAGPSAPRFQDDAELRSSPVAPPPTAPPPSDVPVSRTLVYNPPFLVFEEIYDACVHYVKRHCCYGSRFINQMKLTAIANKGVFHYTLESFGEKRESAFKTGPYKGGPIDGPENGRPPDPWDIPMTPPHSFRDCDALAEIPHTASVSTCGKCSGSGKVRCSSCWGSGRSSCISCGGSGRNSDRNSCSSCGGSGRRTCSRCSGRGRVTCSKCDGYGKLKTCRVLTVTWKNHVIDYTTDIGKLPKEKIRKARGVPILTDQRPKLLPLTNAPEESVNVASERLLSAHQVSFPNELIIQQRHILRAVPFTCVTYQWKEQEGEFYVYDIDRKVYFEDYPQKCCCCICC